MSRCFPYPPPGFAGKSTSEEALILSIKLQEEDKAKSDKKKDRRREKKEKKEKKRKHDKAPPGEKKGLAEEKLIQADNYHKHSKLQTQSKESSYEQMEKSTLTEEHGKPCCSSESTENSGKRKRLSVLPTTNTIRSTGTVIRIRLSTQKRDDPPTPTSGNAALCSTSGRSDLKTTLIPNIPKTSSTPPLKLEPPPCPAKEVLKVPSVKKEAKLPRPLRKYNALFDSWAPPLLEHETPDDEDDWLFSSKKSDVVARPAKRLKCCEGEDSISEIPALQPRARLLEDADIYALPFTVPF